MQDTLMMTQEEIMLGNAAFSSKLNVIHHAYVDIAGDMVAGALLSQILYWFGADRNGRPRARIQKDGYLWIAKARGDWWEEIRITPKQYDRAAKILKEKNLIELRTMKFAGNPTTHIRIKSAELNHAIDNWKREQAQKHMERERQKLMAVGFSPLGNNEVDFSGMPSFTDGLQRDNHLGHYEMPKSVTSLTEITAENKTEVKAEDTHTSASVLNFESIWYHYPKKTGRSKAQRAYEEALQKGANEFAIFVEVILYNQLMQSMLDREETEWRYIPTGGVWFAEERWRDETQLIGRHLGYDRGMQYNRNAAELRRLATAALERGQQGEVFARMCEIIAEMPY